MKKYIILISLVLYTSVLFSFESLNTTRYKTNIDENYSQIEFLLDSNDDMYLFYIKDSKFVIEKKENDVNEFYILEQDIFRNSSTVKRIKRFKNIGSSYTLGVLHVIDGLERVDILEVKDNKIEIINNSSLVNNLSGNISDYNYYSLENNEFYLSYIKSGYFYYTYFNNDEIVFVSTINTIVKELDITTGIVDGKVSYLGYLLDSENNLFRFKLNNDLFSYDLLLTKNDDSNIEFLHSDPNFTRILLTNSNLLPKAYMLNGDDLNPRVIDPGFNPTGSYFTLTASGFEKKFYYKDGSYIKTQDGNEFNNVSKFYFGVSGLYYISDNNAYYHGYGMDETKLLESNVIDLIPFYDKDQVCIIGKFENSINLSIYKNLEKLNSISISQTEYENLDLHNLFNNQPFYINSDTKKLHTLDQESYIKTFSFTKKLIDGNNYTFSQHDIYLTSLNNIYSIEVQNEN